LGRAVSDAEGPGDCDGLGLGEPEGFTCTSAPRKFTQVRNSATQEKNRKRMTVYATRRQPFRKGYSTLEACVATKPLQVTYLHAIRWKKSR
jgi:hypothetical protein